MPVSLKRENGWLNVGALCTAIVLVGVFKYGSKLDLARPANGTHSLHVRGDVAQSGIGVAKMFVVFMSGGSVASSVQTNGHGTFEADLPSTGPYQVLLGMHRNLFSANRTVTIASGLNTLEFQLPPTTLAVTLSTDAPRRSGFIQLSLDGPDVVGAGDRGGFVTADEGDVVLFKGLSFGDYALTAFSSDQQPLTSVEAVRVTLSANAPDEAAKMVLRHRPLTLEVANERGVTIDYAEVHAAHRQLDRLPNGTFDASGVPADMPLMITAPGHVPSCVIARREPFQRALLPEKGKQSVSLTLVGNLPGPGGLVSGLPTSTCSVPIEYMSYKWSRVGRLEIDLTLRDLPAGNYQYRAADGAEAVQLKVPGGRVSYSVPDRCLVCPH